MNEISFGGVQMEVPIPPASWSPVTATDQELAYYHFLPRPSDAAGLARWTNEMSHVSGVIVPEMCPTPYSSLEALIGTDPVSGITYANNWSGVVDNGHSNYTKVYAIMNETTQSLCSGTDPSSHSAWVGIGGWGSNTGLLQNGTLQVGSPAQEVAWWEALNSTYDTHSVSVTNFPVAAGDVISVQTSYAAGKVSFWFHNARTGLVATPSATTVNAYNRTTGTKSAVAVSSMYTGSTAEVIDERDYDYNLKTYHQLRRFSQSLWTSATAAYGGGTSSAVRSLPHLGIDMIQSTGTHLSDVGIESSVDSFHDTWKNCGRLGP